MLFIVISIERYVYNSAIIISSLIKIKTFGCTELFNISLSGNFKIKQLRSRTLSQWWVTCWCSCVRVLLSVLCLGCRHESYLRANLKITHNVSCTHTVRLST